jgi:hypothetical protein
METLGFCPLFGLGDKLSDTLGFLTYCCITGRKPLLEWCKVHQEFPWGVASYDERLFDFGDIVADEKSKDTDIILISHGSSVSCSPHKIHQLLCNYDKIKFELDEIIQKYIFVCQQHIKASELTMQFIPDQIQKCIGIHLRRSDKLTGSKGFVHTTSNNEYNSIIAHMKSYIDSHVESCVDQDVYFFVCSEDTKYKNDFINYLQQVCTKYEKRCIICNTKCITDETKNEYFNIETVVDFFSLSKCTCILQGIKHSTFSMMAALTGRIPLHTFAHHDTNAVLNLWKDCMSIRDHTHTLSDSQRASRFYLNPQIVRSMSEAANSYTMQNTIYNRFSKFRPSKFKSIKI